MNEVNGLVRSVQTAMTEIDQEPKSKKSKQRPRSNGQVVTMPDKTKPTTKAETATKPKTSLLTIAQFTDQPKQAKTVRLPIELCTMLERAKHWQSLEGKTPNTEQDIIAEAVIKWLNTNQLGRTPTTPATDSE